ncbi:MAG: hypothetical protein ABI068_13815 [Ktedonobacterales bacterium]
MEGGDFTATTPYTLLFACEGKGSLTVAWGTPDTSFPETTQSLPCSATPQVNGTQAFTPTNGRQKIRVLVTRQGDVAWELIATVQN